MTPILLLNKTLLYRISEFLGYFMTMKVVHVSFACVERFSDAADWLNHIGFFTGILEEMAGRVDVESVHCIGKTGIQTRNGVRYHMLRVTGLAKLTGFPVSRLVASLNPDVVILHGLMYPVQTWLMRRIVAGNVRVYYQHHAERPMRLPKNLLQRAVDKFVTGYFFASKELALDWVNAGQISSIEKVHEVMEVSSDLRPSDRISFSERRQNYLWVGRLDDNKDPLTLIRGFARFFEAGAPGTLYVIYKGDSLLSKVLELIRGTSQSERIVVVGPVDHHELAKWYSKCGFIISTSHYEGSGTAVCEAMAFGCIPVLSNIPSFRMMTDGGRIGRLFTAGDAEALVDALRQIHAVDLAAESRQVISRFNTTLSFRAIAEKILKITEST